jgi:hypothetical protein
MASCFLAVVLLGVLFVLAASGIKWVIHEHSAASNYRQLERMQRFNPPPQPEQPHGWKVTYKEGRTTKSVIISCEEEMVAVRETLKMGIDPRSILSSERV